VALPDGLQIAIPEWMLDPVYCSSLSFESIPRISVNALLELRVLVDDLLFFGQATGSSLSIRGGIDEQEHDSQRTPTSTGLRKQ
jgi:hypothetical protein